MMFIVRSTGARPDETMVSVKLVRKTPEIVSGGSGKTDHFCIGDASTMAALRDTGWEVVELRDGWYADDTGGGVAIFGHGKYWEIRDTPFTVKEAVPLGGDSPAATGPEGEHVDVRRGIFGV
jgi:hypothetical protein